MRCTCGDSVQRIMQYTSNLSTYLIKACLTDQSEGSTAKQITPGLQSTSFSEDCGGMATLCTGRRMEKRAGGTFLKRSTRRIGFSVFDCDMANRNGSAHAQRGSVRTLHITSPGTHIMPKVTYDVARYTSPRSDPSTLNTKAES